MCGIAFGGTCAVALSVNYMIDSYKEMAGDAMITVIIVRNTMSFAVSYGITSWFTNLGLKNCFISAAFIGLVANSMFLVMIVWGKSFRARSKGKYWKLVQKSLDEGMEH